MLHRTHRLLAALFLLPLLTALPARAQYVPPEQELVVGRPVSVTMPASADTLVVTYRPNSTIAVTERLTSPDSAPFQWTPTKAGVVRLGTPSGEAQDVSVEFNQPPASGILVLTLAGFILFGGAVFAFRKLFAS